MRHEAVPGDRAGRMSGAEGSGLAEPEADRKDGDLTPDGAQSERSQGGPWTLLREMVALLVVALAIALVIKTFVVQPFYIPSGSMEDTLLVGDKVLVNKLVYHLRPIERGDIVVFNGQGSWDPPAKPAPAVHNTFARLYDATLGRVIGWARSLFGTSPGQVDYIKRVIGLPGDHVVCCNARGQITVNGVPLNERSYLAPGARPSQYAFNIVVPPGRLWVMGDNRMFSADSRLHDCGYPDPDTTCAPYDRGGTIPEDKVIGRAFVIVWPLNRMRILRIPATFAHAAALNRARSPAALRSARVLAASRHLVGAAPGSAPLLPLTGGVAVVLRWFAPRRRRRLFLRWRPDHRQMLKRVNVPESGDTEVLPSSQWSGRGSRRSTRRW